MTQEDHAPPRPAWLTAGRESRHVLLDVRDDLRQGREPLGRILEAVAALGADQVLVLRAPFEPLPLYRVLGKRGFAHWAEQHGPKDWSVWFYRGPATADAGSAAAVAAGGTRAPAATSADPMPVSRRRKLDVRELEPPLPMVRVLEALETLEPGQALEVLHDRRPLFLYPQLEARGFLHDTDEPEVGLVRIVIRRPGGTA